MDHNGPGGGGIEPAPVQNGLGLTGPQEAPLSVAQGLHPGVVVVAVGPPGGVDLPGGDAHAAQGGYQEGGFLAATAAAVAEHRQGRGGAVVLELVGGLLMAPAVDLQNPCLLGGEGGYPVPERIVKEGAVEGQVLVVDPREEHIVEKKLLLQRRAPGGLPPQRQGVVGKPEEEGEGVAVQVAGGQVPGQKGHGPPPLRGELIQLSGPEFHGCPPGYQSCSAAFRLYVGSG